MKRRERIAEGGRIRGRELDVGVGEGELEKIRHLRLCSESLRLGLH